MKFSIIKHEPSYFFENIHEDLNRFLRDTFGDMEYLDKTANQFLQTFRPAVEIKEKPDMYKIKIELPNVNKEDIEVELSENFISINAESKCEKCEENENIRTSEFRYGKFQRQIPFDYKINVNEAKSEFKDGVLKIKLPKIEENKKENIKKLQID